MRRRGGAQAPAGGAPGGEHAGLVHLPYLAHQSACRAGAGSQGLFGGTQKSARLAEEPSQERG